MREQVVILMTEDYFSYFTGCVFYEYCKYLTVDLTFCLGLIFKLVVSTEYL